MCDHERDVNREKGERREILNRRERRNEVGKQAVTKKLRCYYWILLDTGRYRVLRESRILDARGWIVEAGRDVVTGLDLVVTS